MAFHPIHDDPDTKMARYEQKVVRPKLERDRQRLIARLPTLRGEEKAAAETELAGIEAKLKGLA